MYQYFKINDPLRLLVSFVILLALGAFMFYLQPIITEQELDWMLLGERVAFGNLPLRDTQSEIAPLAQYFYFIFYILFGKSAMPLRFIGIVLAIIQIWTLSHYIIRNELFRDKNYLITILLVSGIIGSMGWLTLYPAFIGNVFVVLGIGQVVQLLKKSLSEEEHFLTGFYFGLANVFFTPYIYINVFLLLYLLFYSQTTIRKLTVMLFGSVFPMLIVAVLYYVNDATPDFLYYLGQSLLPKPFLFYSQWVWSIPFLAIGFLNLIGILMARQMINYQLVNRQLHFFWLLIALFYCLFFDHDLVGGATIAFFPMLFFAVQAIQEIKRKFLKGLIYNLLIIYGLVIGFLLTQNVLPHEFFKFVQQGNPVVKNEKVWNLSPDMSQYLDNQPASGFYHYKFAKQLLDNTDDYQSHLIVFQDVLKEKPTYILDPKDKLEAFMDNLPQLKEMYTYDSENRMYTRTKP